MPEPRHWENKVAKIRQQIDGAAAVVAPPWPPPWPPQQIGPSRRPVCLRQLRGSHLPVSVIPFFLSFFSGMLVCWSKTFSGPHWIFSSGIHYFR